MKTDTKNPLKKCVKKDCISKMDNSFIKDKHILFIGQAFYDYHEKIATQLRAFGAEVDFFENKTFVADPVISNNVFSKISRFINPNYKVSYNQEIISQIKGRSYDYLFCVGLFSITPSLIEEIKKDNPGIKTILYLWDSFNIWNYSGLLPLFDKCFSFDHEDCKRNENLNYWPLFYTNEYAEKQTEVNTQVPDIDILYIGSLSVASLNRIKVLSWLEDKMNSLNLYLWLYVPSRSNSLLRKGLYVLKSAFDNDYALFWKKVRKYSLSNTFIKNGNLSRNDIVGLMDRTKCVLDITIPNQSGLTMRTIEALANGKKLITTNRYIIEEAFYDSSAIFILNENELSIDVNFIKSEKNKLNIEHLRLDNWLSKLLLND